MEKFQRYREFAERGMARVEAALSPQRDEDGRLTSLSEEVRVILSAYDPETGKLQDKVADYFTLDALSELEAGLSAQLQSIRSIRREAGPKLREALEAFHAGEAERQAEGQAQQRAEMEARHAAEEEARLARAAEELAAHEEREAADQAATEQREAEEAAQAQMEDVTRE